MSDIPLKRYGRVVTGENEGYVIHVHRDKEITGGYYVFLVDQLEDPSDGGDHWVRDQEELAALFRLSEWTIEWSGWRCTGPCA
ncbi:hypothetical protein ACQP0U_23935 [Micromonospora sp. CA-269861]|uniref:hypothetical protein n=1 Tax=Micromonospora sp. CA-269861 TaxID=3239968 RepID=UPI003D8B109F